MQASAHNHSTPRAGSSSLRATQKYPLVSPGLDQSRDSNYNLLPHRNSLQQFSNDFTSKSLLLSTVPKNWKTNCSWMELRIIEWAPAPVNITTVKPDTPTTSSTDQQPIYTLQTASLQPPGSIRQ